MSKPHCQEDGWLCEPGTRCEDHRNDPVLIGEYMAGFAAGYHDGFREGQRYERETPREGRDDE